MVAALVRCSDRLSSVIRMDRLIEGNMDGMLKHREEEEDFVLTARSISPSPSPSPFICSQETRYIHCSMTYDSRTGHTRHVSALTVAHT